MALGSSAPEILLSCIEHIVYLGQPASELGSATIVGSAAFNLFFISAVCIPSVDEPKKIKMMGVFITTSLFSIFAYLWLLFCVSINSPDVITSDEAILTVLYFIILIGLAFAADKYEENKNNKSKTKEDKAQDKINEERKIARTHLRNFSKSKGENAVIEVA
jgi:solute carrier family 8 (sodium/calcium exchanger)